MAHHVPPSRADPAGFEVFARLLDLWILLKTCTCEATEPNKCTQELAQTLALHYVSAGMAYAAASHD